MTLRVLQHFVLALTVSVCGTAHAAQPSAASSATSPAASPSETQLARTPLGYRILMRLAGNLEETFATSLGLVPQLCRFKNSVTRKSFEHNGIAACLYRSWRAGQKTTEIPGVIEALVTPTRGRGESVGMELTWRAAEGNLWKTLSRLVKMRADKGLPEEMRAQTFLGTILVKFSEPLAPTVLLGPRAGLLLAYQERGIERLELTTHHDASTGRETHGKILFFTQGEVEPAFELEIHTNFNLLKKRGFFLMLEGR